MAFLRQFLRRFTPNQVHGILGRTSFPEGAIMYFDASKNKPLLPVTYNGKYLVVKNV